MSSRIGPLRRVALVVIFVASLFALDRLVALALERTVFSREQQEDMTLKLREAREAGPYEVLIFGTSRTFEAIHPADILEGTGARAYKEAYQGRGPRYQYEFYRRYREVVGRPRVVVYGVDYFLFSIRSTPSRLAAFGIKAKAQTAGVRWPLRLLQDKESNDQGIVWTLQRWQMRPTAGRRRGEPDRERYPKDMEEYRGTDRARQGDPAEPPPARYQKIPFARFPGEEGEDFVRLLDLLEADGVNVLLVGLPDFIATYRSDYEQRRFAQTFTRLAAAHRRCTFVNYNRPDRFPLSDATLFLDGKYGNPNSHMSRAGVAPFLRVFLPDLKAALAAAPARP